MSISATRSLAHSWLARGRCCLWMPCKACRRRLWWVRADALCFCGNDRLLWRRWSGSRFTALRAGRGPACPAEQLIQPRALCLLWVKLLPFHSVSHEVLSNVPRWLGRHSLMGFGPVTATVTAPRQSTIGSWLHVFCLGARPGPPQKH